MNDKIERKISFLEQKQITMLTNTIDDPIETYNTIINTYFSDKFLSNVGLGSAGAILLKASAITTTITPLPGYAALTSASTAIVPVGTAAASTAIAPVGSAALSSTVLGGASVGATAGGSSIIPVIGPIITAAIGGFMVGNAIGDFVLDDIIFPKQGMKKLDELGANVNLLKAYCKSMIEQLSYVITDINSAIGKVELSEKKLQKAVYATKDANLRRIQYRKTELVTILTDIGLLKNVLLTLNENLSKIN